MIIKGLKWCSSFGGWGDIRAQVEFSDGETTRYIIVTYLDEEYTVFISSDDILDVLDEKIRDGYVPVMDGELDDLLPEIQKSPYAFDICFVVQALKNFPGFQFEDRWESSAAEYINDYINKDSSEVK